MINNQCSKTRHLDAGRLVAESILGKTARVLGWRPRLVLGDRERASQVVGGPWVSMGNYDFFFCLKMAGGIS